MTRRVVAVGHGEFTDPGPPPGGLTGDINVTDFSDGLNGWTMAGHTPTDYEIIADPTGSGAGELLHLMFINRTEQTEGTLRDQDVEIQAVYDFDANQIGPGDSLFSYCKIYLVDNGVEHNRKLWRFYAANNASDVTLWVWDYLRIEGPEASGGLVFYNTSNNGSGMGASWGSGQMAFDTWYELEVEMTLDSVAGEGDGIFRVWLDRTLIYENTSFNFIETGSTYIDSIHIGNQSHGGRIVYGPTDDNRYFDDLILSTTRIAA